MLWLLFKLEINDENRVAPSGFFKKPSKESYRRQPLLETEIKIT